MPKTRSSRAAPRKARKPTASKRSPRAKDPASALLTTYPADSGTTLPSAQDALRQRAADDTAGLSSAQLLEIYTHLFETRRLEEHLVALARQGQVVGGVYRSLGQEATAVGCTYALRDGDFIQPLIRDLGAMLVHGVEPLAFFRQYMARATGPSGGRDLNQHFSAPELGILGPVSMLGAMIPVLAGALLASRYRKLSQVGIAFIGDGGSSTGAFYEGVNFAAVQKLPLIVVIEANHFAYSTPTTAQVPGGDIVRRAQGFGCAVTHVDGNDVVACYQATRDARSRGLAGEGPTLLVAETYRRRGHAEHDNQAYVDPEEIESWAGHNDPLQRFVDFLTRGKHAKESALEAIRTSVDSQLNSARDQAVSEPFPDTATLTHAVFDDGTSPHPPYSSWFRGGPKLRAAGDVG